MVQTRQQLSNQEEVDQLQFSQELERLGVIEVQQTNSWTQQQHIVYRPISFIMTAKLVNNILSKNLEELPKFSGKINENVRKWLIDITNELNLVNLDDQQKFSVIQTFLLDDARRWFINNMRILTDWSTFVIQIQKTFSSTMHQELAIRTVGARQQGLTETVLHYYNEMMELFDMIESGMNDQVKVSYLKAGLKVSLKKDVMRNDPKDPVQFLEIAQAEEKLDSSIFTPMDNAHQLTFDALSTIKSSTRPYEQYQPQQYQQYQEQQSQQQSRQQQYQQQQYHQQPYPEQQQYQQRRRQYPEAQQYHRQYPEAQQYHQQQPQSQRRQSSTKSRCYRCDREGHFARDCFSKNY